MRQTLITSHESQTLLMLKEAKSLRTTFTVGDLTLLVTGILGTKGLKKRREKSR